MGSQRQNLKILQGIRQKDVYMEGMIDNEANRANLQAGPKESRPKRRGYARAGKGTLNIWIHVELA